jgi:hypothetical protein
MHGIRAYNTGGLRANFAGSDLIVETGDLRKKLWVQVKTGAPNVKDHVYLTQCSGDADLEKAKFSSDFVVFVNLDVRAAKSHSHDGTLDFGALTFYVVPCKDANRIYQAAVPRSAAKPKRDGGQRKLANKAVHVPFDAMARYKNAWGRLGGAREV